MAFNPFTNFRKYQKFWMAAILLVCMVTFILCTGTGTGDLSDRILRWVGGRGQVYTTIDGAKFYASEA
ncbi:MAG: hypothetical protein NZO58_08185, partial [Gemmataceae bacterium]|nr:hypothetical protein [Gemmataceae bacterium]